MESSLTLYYNGILDPPKAFLILTQYNRKGASLVHLQASKDRRFPVLLFAVLYTQIMQHRHRVAVSNYPLLPCCTYARTVSSVPSSVTLGHNTQHLVPGLCANVLACEVNATVTA
jgi:hypothetical protein